MSNAKQTQADRERNLRMRTTKSLLLIPIGLGEW
jgi:hypothetical protein